LSNENERRLSGLLNISQNDSYIENDCKRPLIRETSGSVQKGLASPVLSPLKERPQPLWQAERTGGYVSMTKRRPACALALEALQGVDVKPLRRAGNAAGLPAEPTPPK
jgi:hypothetical protein